MPKRIANMALVLHRQGKRTEVKAGELVDLTAKELEDFKRLNPNAVRLPRNESVVDSSAAAPVAPVKEVKIPKAAKPVDQSASATEEVNL